MNYPGGIKSKKTVNTKVNISFKNRGMDLEDDLNSTNNYYIDKSDSFRCFLYNISVILSISSFFSLGV